jgi:hypothetical protein
MFNEAPARGIAGWMRPDADLNLIHGAGSGRRVVVQFPDWQPAAKKKQVEAFQPSGLVQ